MKEADYLIIASIYVNDIIKKMLYDGFTLWNKVIVMEPTPLTKALGICDYNEQIMSADYFSQYSAKYGVNNVGQLTIPEPNHRMVKMISPDIDPVRKYVLSMISEEIYAHNVNGDIAEFGVFTGEFAKELNAVFADRRCLLFDTFEGFPEREVNAVRGKYANVTEFIDACSNTSIDLVKSKLPHLECCEFYPGIFPESTRQIKSERKYAFVSIDVDFMENTLAGLRYFYPRLETGGYIMVHDYNNKNEYGDFGSMVKQAVRIFEEEIHEMLCKVPICDRGGTVVIMKNI